MVSTNAKGFETSSGFLPYNRDRSVTTLEQEMLETVEWTIAEYNMFISREVLYVALSGGKDSIATMMLLSRLGYEVVPLIVDTGDPLFNSGFVKTIALNVGLEPVVLQADNLDLQREILHPEKYQRLTECFRSLESLRPGQISCANCYEVKMIVMESHVASKGGNAIVIGQHKDDMITSLLKCYWIDLYYRYITIPQGIPYDGQRMKALIADLPELDLALLKELVEEERAATDDPFMEFPFESGVRIARPLGNTREMDIEDFVYTSGVNVAGSFCSHKVHLEAEPFRILVHDDYHRRVVKQPELEDVLMELVYLGLDGRGTWRFRPRNNRHIHYPGFKPFVKKL